MPYVGLFSILFGGIILYYPDTLSYIIGALFLFVGVQLTLFSLIFRRNQSSGFHIGGYEIIRRKK